MSTTTTDEPYRVVGGTLFLGELELPPDSQIRMSARSFVAHLQAAAVGAPVRRSPDARVKRFERDVFGRITALVEEGP